MISNLVRKKIQAFNLEQDEKQVLLQRVQKGSVETNKKEEIFKICINFIKDGGKLIENRQTKIVNVIIQLVQDLLNEICLRDETYDWMVLRVHCVCLRLRYLFACPSVSQANKSTYIKRISYFLQQIANSCYYKKLKQDYYSHIEVCFFYAILDALKNKKIKKSQFLIHECFNSLKYQIQSLTNLLQYEDEKVFEIIKNKTCMFLKLYGIQITHCYLQTFTLNESRIWYKYNKILNKVPNKTQQSQIIKIIQNIFQSIQKKDTKTPKKQESHEDSDDQQENILTINMMSTILEEDNDEKQQKDVYKIIFINDDQEKDKDKQSLKLSSCDSNSENLQEMDTISELSEKNIKQIIYGRKEKERSKSKKKNKNERNFTIFHMAINNCKQYETKLKRSLSETEMKNKFRNYLNSSQEKQTKLKNKKTTFVLPKCLSKNDKLKL